MSENVLVDFPQYLSFKLDAELYAINIVRVREVLDLIKITKVPKTPAFMLGVINLRGSVVPVIDLKVKFDMAAIENTRDTCIIIVNVLLNEEYVTLGLLADSVNEVIELAQDEIEPTPRIGARISNDFIKGMGKHNEDFIMILDIDKIFSEQEILQIQPDQEPVKATKENKKKVKKTAVEV